VPAGGREQHVGVPQPLARSGETDRLHYPVAGDLRLKYERPGEGLSASAIVGLFESSFDREASELVGYLSLLWSRAARIHGSIRRVQGEGCSGHLRAAIWRACRIAACSGSVMSSSVMSIARLSNLP
jgi:hypothetical protein